ncbi:hypothetical protein RZ87_02635 [Enterobacter roggenkampii]|nr:hypothetical protein RZ87_02635 [Enterobacter roggenkampii]
MCPETDRTDLPGDFSSQPLATQSACDFFNVIFRKIWRTIPLFCFSKGFADRRITGQPELLPVIRSIMQV